MMTLDEAIRHETEVAEKYTEDAMMLEDRYALTRESCLRCAEDRRQIAEWLKELKERRAKDESQTAERAKAEAVVMLLGLKGKSQTVDLGNGFSITANDCDKPKTESQICDFCKYYNSNIPCGTTPSACEKADKFAKEFVDELKKLKSKDEPQI